MEENRGVVRQWLVRHGDHVLYVAAFLHVWVCPYAKVRIYFCAAPYNLKMENAHLSSLPQFDKCHETSRIFTRTCQEANAFPELYFLGKMAAPPQPLKVKRDIFLPK